MKLMTFGKLLRLVPLALLCAALAACSGGGGGPQTNPTLTVRPAQASVEAGQTLQLTATTADVTTPTFVYEIAPPVELATATATQIAQRFGTVNANGQFIASENAEAGLRGSVVVRETTETLSQTVPVVIVPPIDVVVLDPDEASLLAGESRQFTARAFDFEGNEITYALVTWGVAGNVGRISASGLFTATTAGEGQVTAVVGLAAPGTADVTVVGTLVGLDIVPRGNPALVEEHTQRQFTAVVRDAQGNQTEVPATWTFAPGTAGSVSATGLFTAGALGQEGVLTAVAQGQTATLTIRVVALLTPPADQPRNVFGTVRTSAAAPAANATVSAVRASDSLAVQTTTAADGAYSLFLRVGTWRVQAVSADSLSTAVRDPLVVAAQDVVQQVNLTLAP